MGEHPEYSRAIEDVLSLLLREAAAHWGHADYCHTCKGAAVSDLVGKVRALAPRDAYDVR